MNVVNAVLLKVGLQDNIPIIYYYHEGKHSSAVLVNPEVLSGSLISGIELKMKIYPGEQSASGAPEVELLPEKTDYLPARFVSMLEESPPEHSTFFGLCSKTENGRGRYYMLRDLDDDGLLLCTGIYSLKKDQAVCSIFDGEWHLRYNIVENFFYSFERPESQIIRWKHPSIRLKKIDDSLSYKQLTKRHRNYAAGWHRYNYFWSDDWSKTFYCKQARLGFIAITNFEDGRVKLLPQLQREYAVLDWQDLNIDRKTAKIINSNRIADENIRLNISADPAEVLTHLRTAWEECWITKEYADLIESIAADCREKRDRKMQILGVSLTADKDSKIIAGELGYTIGKTYTSLSGFFHREDKRFNNFGKLQMVLLAGVLENSGIAFWNLGQPYMEYKLKLGAKVVPRGLFLKRWDKAVKGRTPKLQHHQQY
ncbi:MAG: hypothetical protein PQJ61_14035 [Spirochaetales bacterium]|uniref:Uncharacterized protein n=1 Tax=Candidatus Thalassospirochaeta sargassi TaxID=3119039 RepID=A0AAJ1MLI5_9SPIO|nr:hypothetical protein [Spirochaetales bacterium]